MVTRNPTEHVWPISLFVDGVPYSQVDSVIGFWLVNMVNGQRYVFATLRKKFMCRCGCKGWCSLFAMFRCLRWCLTSLSAGVYPAERHDGSPWKPSDAARAVLANTPLGVKAALIHVKGDWAEYNSTLGFPAWNSSVRACFACNVDTEHMDVYAGARPNAFPFRENEDEDYFNACARCERIAVIPSGVVYAALCARLVYDKRLSGNRGRCLT